MYKKAVTEIQIILCFCAAFFVAERMGNVQLSDREWKAFKSQKFFKEISVKHKLTKRQLYNAGVVPVLASQMENGGIIGFTNGVSEFFINKQTAIYVVFGDHTREFRIMECNFSVTDNVKVLLPMLNDYNNKYVLLFLLNSWKKAIPDLGYARHWRAAKRSKILLPVTDTGEPDYQFMEDYIKKLMLKKYFQYLI